MTFRARFLLALVLPLLLVGTTTARADIKFASVDMQRAPLEGNRGVYRIVLSDVVRPWSTVIDYKARKIYWCDATMGAIRRANLDGTSPETVMRNVPEVFGVEMESANGKVNWGTGGKEK